jgi:omega-6 fatty acid desaturase (delta-12 desaturase)
LRRLAPFRQPENGKAIFETAITLLAFAAFWWLMLLLSQHSYLLTLALSVPTAGLLVRLFIIQHDCGHGAMFTSRAANSWTGRALGALTMTPYDMWRNSHALHHASSGHLDKRGIGDITTLTVNEYRSLSLLGRAGYRIYRHPLIMFVIGPAYLFLLHQRVPVGAMNLGLMPWLSTMGTNAAILAVSAPLIWFLGWSSFLLVHLPVICLGASIGVWLFYVQHQFEHTSWEREEDWSQPAAALHGSSFYDLPRPLMWITGNIGIHHLHHLSSRIPFYRLREALDANPELKGAGGRLTFWQSLRCVRLTLWDEERRQLVSFAQLRKPPAR